MRGQWGTVGKLHVWGGGEAGRCWGSLRMQWDARGGEGAGGSGVCSGGVLPLCTYWGSLLLCVLTGGAFLLSGCVVAGCAPGGTTLFLLCACKGRGAPAVCPRRWGVRGEGTPAACACAGCCRCVRAAGRGAPAKPPPCVHAAGCCAQCVCVCACAVGGSVCAPCVCVSAVGRGAGALGACACAAGGAGLPACGEERGSPPCVLVQRGKGCALLVRAKGAGGGIHRELGVVLCVSVRVIRMRTCNSCACTRCVEDGVQDEESYLVHALGNKSSVLWLVCTFKGARSLAAKLYYLGYSCRSFFPAQREDGYKCGCKGGVCVYVQCACRSLTYSPCW